MWLARSASARSRWVPKDKVNYAGVVHDEATTALKFDPRHSGALHIMGVWNAEIMRLSGFSRFMAKNLLGGKTFGEASWDNAQKDLEEAVSIDPARITHHLDLGMVYKDRDMKDKAREQFEWIAKAPVTVEFDDKFYKQKAAAALAGGNSRRLDRANPIRVRFVGSTILRASRRLRRRARFFARDSS